MPATRQVARMAASYRSEQGLWVQQFPPGLLSFCTGQRQAKPQGGQ